MLIGLWDRFSDWICTAGVPLVYAYQLLCTDPFLCTQVENAKGLEYIADQVLSPVHYLLAARVAIPVEVKSEDGTVLLQYQFKQRFQYKDRLFWPKTITSLAALPVSLTAGVLLKGAAYLAPEVRAHYSAIRASETSRYVDSRVERYKSLGLPIGDYKSASFIDPPQYVRRPGDENHLPVEKAALKEVIGILEANNILCWVDCGTCLGAYRYGGVIPWDWDVDLSIFEEDHDNACRALNALDPAKYVVQDWSARSRPDTYLRVYIKETGAEIDLYHFRIDPVAKTIHSVLSFEENMFMVESWLIRERRFTNPMPFDRVFPLKKAHFDGIVVPVPNQIEDYLRSEYGQDLRPVKIYNDQSGQWEKDFNHPYWQRAHVR